MPMTAFIGVRISWLIEARNSDFARVAARAWAWAASRASSAALYSEMSTITPMSSRASPSATMTDTMSRSHTRRPSCVTTRYSIVWSRCSAVARAL